MRNKLKSIIKSTIKFYEIKIRKNSFRVSMYKWIDDKGDLELRFNYPLNENSTVIDVGGFDGEYAEKLLKLFNCKIYIIEPIPNFCQLIKEKFMGNEKVILKEYALSNVNGESKFYLNANASSQYHASDECIIVRTKATRDLFKELNTNSIDLMKLNVEGAEFEILEDLINNNLLEQIKHLQIQFHKLDDSSDTRRENIRNELLKSHVLDWDYPWIWESWSRRKL